MTIADELVVQPSGARFYRADLHIHSFQSSHDVEDTTMTPAAIVNTAVAEGLHIVAITDHNEISNVSELIQSSKGKPILAVPGVELSTPEGHLLVYFEDVHALATYYGNLAFADRGTEKSRCQTSMLDCLKHIDANRGFAILAHVDAAGGLEEKVPGNPPHKGDILCARTLLGIELQSSASRISYSPIDPESERALFGKRRISELHLGQNQYLGRVLFSDSHTLAALGKNAQGNRKMTRFKMDLPSFRGLKVALEDADARIRLEDDIPLEVPYLMGVKLEGGFLDGQIVHLSRNLNCIIGGRGAGKSSLFEAIRIAGESQSQSRLIDSEIWPEVISLVWVDGAGEQHTVVRRINQELSNIDDPQLGPLKFPMEAYGQNETAQTSVRAQTNPYALLEYLDHFIAFEDLKFEEEAIRQSLLENQTQIEKAELEVAKIPDYKRLAATTQQQLQAIEKAKATEVVSLERKIAEERALRSSVETKIGELSSQAKQSAMLTIVSDLRRLVPREPLQVGVKEYASINLLVDSFEGRVTAAKKSIADDVKSLVAGTKIHLDQWKAREQQAVTTIESKRKELAAQGVKLDIAYIRKLASDEANYKKSLATLLTWESFLKDLKTKRTELLKQRIQLASKISARRVAYAVKASDSLKGALGELTVSVKFVEGTLSENAEGIIQRAMGWRTTQVPRTALLVEQVGVE